MAKDPKPCPFSHPVKLGPKVDDTGHGAVVVCQDCGAHGPERPTYAEAVRAWNHRRGHDGDGN
jgi:hypothetical protein